MISLTIRKKDIVCIVRLSFRQLLSFEVNLQKLAQSSNAEGSITTNGVDNCRGQPTHGVNLRNVEYVPVIVFEGLQNPATGKHASAHISVWRYKHIFFLSPSKKVRVRDHSHAQLRRTVHATNKAHPLDGGARVCSTETPTQTYLQQTRQHSLQGEAMWEHARAIRERVPGLKKSEIAANHHGNP